jgi:probable phosphomutase (TIGR03848 family)
MTEFWLIRHGSMDTLDRSIAGRREGVQLNERGRAEVQALARRLRGERFAGVYVSPMERTRETARAVAAAVECDAIEHPGLLELDFGEWTGMEMPELQRDERWRLFNEFRSGTRIPGGETMLEVQARVVAALFEFRAAHPHAKVLLVSHGDVIRALLTYVLGMPIDFYGRLEVAPASITCVSFDTHGLRIARLNDVAHVERWGQTSLVEQTRIDR